MHIEPGFIAQAKVIVANTAAVGMVGFYAKDLLWQPKTIIKTVLAAIFFSIFMQAFHLPAGPSELHLLGAMPIYLLFGFTPALLGFGLGLLFQGMFFAPTDLMHLGVNSLSLMIPMVAVHLTFGQKIASQTMAVNFKNIAKLDGMFYAGVTAMVGFWLIGEAVSFSAWMSFVVAYLPVVIVEPAITILCLKALQGVQSKPWASYVVNVEALQVRS